MGEAFTPRWKRKWSACGFEDIGIEFVHIGADTLPTVAAPCLSFDYASRPQPIWEVFGFPSEWSDAERERLAPYRMIGSDGAGNPICVEQGAGAVVLLDHESHPPASWLRQFHLLHSPNLDPARVEVQLPMGGGEAHRLQNRPRPKSHDRVGLDEIPLRVSNAVGNFSRRSA